MVDKTLIALAAMAALALPGAAAAQQGPVEGGTTDEGTIGDGTIDGVPLDEIGDSDPRRGEATGEDLQEMPISDILNAMSRRGYARYDRVERVGTLYRFHVVTTDFRQVVVEVDPIARTIRELPL